MSKTVNVGGSKGGCAMLQDSDEEKLMILFEKNVAKRSANDFKDSQVGKVVLWDLCRTLCNSRHSFLGVMAVVGDKFPIIDTLVPAG